MHRQPFKRRRTCALVGSLSVASLLALGAYAVGGSPSPTLAATYRPLGAMRATTPSYEQFLSTHGGRSSARLARLWRARFGPGAPGPEVMGVVRDADGRPLAGARVTLRFLDASGVLLRQVAFTLGPRGRWGKWGPPGARSVRVVVGEAAGGRTVTGALPLRPGARLSTTVTFPDPGVGLLPAVFPY